MQWPSSCRSLDDEGSDADRKLPKVISPTDPCSAWTAKANKRVQFGYGLNYMIDLEHAVIVDVEATPARTYDEVAATRTMIDRTEMAFGLKPARLTADTAYGTGKLLAWLLDRDITPHIPVWDRYQRTDGMFSHLDFTYDNARDVYICPNGRSLGTSGTVHDGRVRNYLSRPADCRAPPHRACRQSACRAYSGAIPALFHAVRAQPGSQFNQPSFGEGEFSEHTTRYSTGAQPCVDEPGWVSAG